MAALRSNTKTLWAWAWAWYSFEAFRLSECSVTPGAHCPSYSVHSEYALWVQMLNYKYHLTVISKWPNRIERHAVAFRGKHNDSLEHRVQNVHDWFGSPTKDDVHTQSERWRNQGSNRKWTQTPPRRTEHKAEAYSKTVGRLRRSVVGSYEITKWYTTSLSTRNCIERSQTIGAPAVGDMWSHLHFWGERRWSHSASRNMCQLPDHSCPPGSLVSPRRGARAGVGIGMLWGGRESFNWE